MKIATKERITIRRWGYWTVALWVDGCFKGTFATREDAERVGAYLAEALGNKQESPSKGSV